MKQPLVKLLSKEHRGLRAGFVDGLKLGDNTKVKEINSL